MRQYHHLPKKKGTHRVEAMRDESSGSATRATRQPELCQAAGLGNLSLVQRLIDIGEDVSVKANDGSTPLHCASRAGHVDVLVLLLESGCALSENNCMSRTALQEAALENHVEIVKILVNRGGEARSILHTVIKTGTKELIELLIQNLGFEKIRPADHWLWEKGLLTPLHLAAHYGNEPILQALLLDPEANPNQKSSARWAPLHYAAISGHEGIVNILLESQVVNVNLPGRYGRTPLICAAMKGHEEVVKRLLACESLYIELRGHDKCTAAHLAASFGALPVLKLLLRDKRLKTACFNVDKNCPSLLQSAAESGRLETVEWLLSTQDNYKTPNIVNEHLLLHWAVNGYQADVVKLLLARKDVDIERRADQAHYFRHWQNKTAIQKARDWNRQEIVNILLAHGAIDHSIDDPALPTALEVSTLPPRKVPGMENESIQDLDMDETTALDLEMQDSYMEEFVTYDGDNGGLESSQSGWRPWET
jgi:ankyrin repeat protein